MIPLSAVHQPEHQQLIVDAGALTHLVELLKRHKSADNSRAVNGVVKRAADAITNLAHENSVIKTRVRFAYMDSSLFFLGMVSIVIIHILWHLWLCFQD
jgi:hypothetical protein